MGIKIKSLSFPEKLNDFKEMFYLLKNIDHDLPEENYFLVILK